MNMRLSGRLGWVHVMTMLLVAFGTLAYGADPTHFKAESDGNLNTAANWTGGTLPLGSSNNSLTNRPGNDLRVFESATLASFRLSAYSDNKAIYIDLAGYGLSIAGDARGGLYGFAYNTTNRSATNALIVVSNGTWYGNSTAATWQPFYGLAGGGTGGTNNEFRLSNVRADFGGICAALPATTLGESNRVVITDGSMVTVRVNVAVGLSGNVNTGAKPMALFIKGGSVVEARGTNAVAVGGSVGVLTGVRTINGGILSIEDAGTLLLATNGAVYIGKYDGTAASQSNGVAHNCIMSVLGSAKALVNELHVGWGQLNNGTLRTNNQLLVSGAGSFVNVTNFMGVGYYPNSRKSLATVETGGRLAVTNTGSPAVLWVSNGTLKVSGGGTVDVDRLVMTVGSTGLLWNGRMNVATGYVESAAASVVGDGATKMIYAPSAADKTNVFTTWLLVMANSELAGVGNIVTPAFTNDGTISPAESTTVGKLTLTAANKWNGGSAYRVNISDVAGAAGTGYDRVDVVGALAIAAATGSKMTIALVETGSSGFSESTDYDWTIGTASGGITTNADWYTLNTAAFYPLAGGVFSVDVSGNNLVLRYRKPAGGVPLPPTLNAASGVTGWKFVANWAAGGGGAALGYTLDVSTDSAFGSFVGAYHDLALGLVTTYDVSGLTPGTPYYYRLRATNITGNSDYSVTNTVTTPAAPVIANPFVTNIFSSYATLSAEITSIQGAAVSQRGFTWSDSIGFDPATGTKVFENGSFGVGVYSLVATAMPVGVDVYYRGYAINPGGTNYTEEQTFWTGPESPGALAATNVWITRFYANWEAPLGVSVAAYYLDVSANASFTTYQGIYSNLNVGTALTYPVTNLTGDTPYYYRVRVQRDPDLAMSTNSGTIAVTTVNADCRWTSTVNGVFSDTAKWLNGNVPGGEQRAWFMPTNGVTVEFDGSKTNLQANFFNGIAFPITLGMGPDVTWYLTNTTVSYLLQIGALNEGLPTEYKGWVRQTNGTIIINSTGGNQQTVNIGQRQTGVLEIDGASAVMRVMDGSVQIGRPGYPSSRESKMILTNGATFEKLGNYGGVTVGMVSGGIGGSNTQMVVDNSTAFLTSLNNAPLVIGGNGSPSNTVEVRNNGLLRAVVTATGSPTNCAVGSNLSSGNVLRVTSGGRLFATNATVTSLTVVEAKNTMFIDGGTATVDRIDIQGAFSLANGKLTLKGTGLNTFANGLAVPANSILVAQGTVAGTTTVAGVFSPADIGTAGSIVFSNGLSLGAGSTLDVDVYYVNGTNHQDHISIQGDAASYDMTCSLVFNTGAPYQLVSQGSYCIITNADGKLTGTVTPSGLPANWSLSQDAYQVTLTRNDSPATYVINATGGAHGTVTPSGNVGVSEGRDQAFTFHAASYYNLSQIWTNGAIVSGGVTNTNSVTFTWLNVVAPGTVTATQVALVATNNNTPLWWLAQYGLTAANELANSDNDGQANYLEYIAGTDPTNGASYWQQETFTAGNTAVIMWTNIADRTYHVYYKTNLVDTTWTQAAAYTNRPAGTIAYTNDNANLLRYYRVTVVNTNK